MNPLEQILQALLQAFPASQQAMQDPTGFMQQLKQPSQVSGDLVNALAGTMPLIGGMAKVFKPAATEAMPYADRLLTALKSYTNPMELTKVKNRLQPALQIAEGEPNLATNLLVGKGFGGHGPLYEQVQSMPSAAMKHGYFDPTHQIFLDDALNTLLYDPEKLKTSTNLLGKGMSLDAVIEALGFVR